MVCGAAYAVDGRIAQVDVGAGHVDLGAQHHGAVFVLAIAHFTKKRHVFGGSACAERAVHAGLAEVATVDADLLHRLLVHVGVARFDQVLGGAVHEVEVVAGLIRFGVGRAVPVEAQPLDGVTDRVDVLDIFLLRVGVVKAEVADATVIARQAKVQADALGVADVQVAIGLGGKAGADFGRVKVTLRVVCGVARATTPAALRVSAFGQILLDDLAQEVAGLGGRFDGCRCAHDSILVGAWSPPLTSCNDLHTGADIRHRHSAVADEGADRCSIETIQGELI